MKASDVVKKYHDARKRENWEERTKQETELIRRLKRAKTMKLKLYFLKEIYKQYSFTSMEHARVLDKTAESLIENFSLLDRHDRKLLLSIRRRHHAREDSYLETKIHNKWKKCVNPGAIDLLIW